MKRKRRPVPRIPSNKRSISTRADPNQLSLIDEAQRDAFGFLNLDSIKAKSGKTRTHVNPLSLQYTTPISPPDWSSIYEDQSKRLLIDVGTAAGRFVLASALKSEAYPRTNTNYLGIEVRAPLVKRATDWAEGLNVGKDVTFLCCSANSSLQALCDSYPGDVACIAVQFPDPHFKRKHRKRRVVDAAFLRVAGEVLRDGGMLVLVSDVEEISAEMRDRADACATLERVGEYTPRDAAFPVGGSDDSKFWTQDGKATNGTNYGDWHIGPNPLGIPTERECQNVALGLPIYRSVFAKRLPQ